MLILFNDTVYFLLFSYDYDECFTFNCSIKFLDEHEAKLHVKRKVILI